MSSNQIDSRARPSAEAAYREAFERLKQGHPERLPEGTPVSQNNVAREAGSDPSALRKSRFPGLIADIQRYLATRVDRHPPSRSQTLQSQRRRNRNLRDRIEDLTKQRDAVACLLNEANAKILELSDRVAELEAKLPSNLTPIPRR
ncbi:hypothetical protein [Paraburkholderia diazotrophica]|uniref:Uncharacterized protein n=1 Tax=Paraburkholderia diazotrophica TaxID=667676 RepID=A0A1H7DCN2_9BURK|nr:hypothetical protein [Paraburkholderia diazotrophica]SEJ99563.1 hypothetical protein SAMN05192539_102892 [Paraburkholderia diazotrophica]